MGRPLRGDLKSIRNENRERQQRPVGTALMTFAEYQSYLLQEVKKIDLEEQEEINQKDDRESIYPHTQAAAIRLLIQRLDKKSQKILCVRQQFRQNLNQ